MTMTHLHLAQKASVDPVTVLRGHRTDVQALAFHPGLDLLYSGYAYYPPKKSERYDSFPSILPCHCETILLNESTV
jgi:hypothetical protein